MQGDDQMVRSGNGWLKKVNPLNWLTCTIYQFKQGSFPLLSPCLDGEGRQGFNIYDFCSTFILNIFIMLQNNVTKYRHLPHDNIA
jgi:hypothetical protein